MVPIGGYFELELPDRGGFPHDDGVLLNSGRNALEYVFRALGNVRHLYMPYYTCDVVMEPIEKLSIPYSFYHINQSFELDVLPTLNSGDYLVYTNYYGIKDEYVYRLAEHYGSQLIVDNAQAWFAQPIKGVNTIYSPRKYVGVPDGGVAYCTEFIEERSFESDVSYERCSHLLKRMELDPAEGYVDFKSNSKKLSGQPVKQMSRLTRKMLSSIDYEVVRNRRRKNFDYLQEHLGKTNCLEMPCINSFACPMIYPYLTNDPSLRQRLIENKIFVATYWPNIKEWASRGMLEYELMEKLMPLPIDQRYGIEEMDTIISIIKNR